MLPWQKNLQRIVVFGLGSSGRAAARLALAKGFAVDVFDSGDNDDLRKAATELQAVGANVHLGSASRPGPPDLAVMSPGIKADSELGRRAGDLGCPVVSEFEFGGGYCRSLILAVTGSNGKTTTVEMTVHCLRQGGIEAIAAGNIGLPLSTVAMMIPPPTVVVGEISSFQLATIHSLQVESVAYLNLSLDHLDWHGSFDAYAEAKSRILKLVQRAEQVILREDLVGHFSIEPKLKRLPGQPCLFSAATPPSERADFFIDQQGFFCRRGQGGVEPKVFGNSRDLVLPGQHNQENALAAIALCQVAGLSPPAAAQALADFHPSAHRLQTVIVHQGVRIVNDSKATNPDALCRALQAMQVGDQKNIVLIAGGLDKGMAFSQVKPWLAKAVKKVYCYGSCRDKLVSEWKDAADCEPGKDFSYSVKAALAIAESGDTVLLSPGCASQDMFKDYAERGNVFIQLITREIQKNEISSAP